MSTFICPNCKFRLKRCWRCVPIFFTDLTEEAVGAAVAVVVEDDLLARADEAGHGRQGCHPGAEGERLVAVLEFADLEGKKRDEESGKRG